MTNWSVKAKNPKKCVNMKADSKTCKNIEISASELVGDQSEMVVNLFFHTFYTITGWLISPFFLILGIDVIPRCFYV